LSRLGIVPWNDLLYHLTATHVILSSLLVSYCADRRHRLLDKNAERRAHRPPADTGGPSVRARRRPPPSTTSWMGIVSSSCCSTAFFAAVASSATNGCKADFAGVTVQDVRLVSNRSEKQEDANRRHDVQHSGWKVV